MTDPEDDEDIFAFSERTQAALDEYFTETQTREKRFADLKAKAEEDAAEPASLTMEDFTEDWNASQFWYEDDTAILLAEKLLEGTTDDSCIACISAPSVFIQLKRLLALRLTSPQPTLVLLEYDTRFAVFKEYEHYDFQHPIRLPPTFRGKFDRVICDPPFLSIDCQTKAALTARWLTKSGADGSTSVQGGDAAAPSRLIVCTGERMTELVHKLYRQAGARRTTFEPRHAKGLSNEFACYTNFECAEWTWR